MSYVENHLLKCEKIVFKASASWWAYLTALISFSISFYPMALLRLISMELALTDKRIIGRTGMLGRTIIMIPHARIERIFVQQGGLGKIFDYGKVVIISRDGSKTTFKGIKWPLVLQQEVDEAIEVAVLGRKLSDFDKVTSPTDEEPSTSYRF